MGNCPPLTTMPFYEYFCQKHGRFEVRQPMFSEKVADCPKCGQPAERRISLPFVRIALPLTIYQELPNGQGYMEIDKKPDSESIRPPTPPEELVRIGELPNNADILPR